MKTIRDLLASVLIVGLIAGAVAMFSVIGAIAGSVVSAVLAVGGVYIFVHNNNKNTP